jgi:hypothetical protein
VLLPLSRLKRKPSMQRRHFRNNKREYLKDNDLETNRTKI